MKAGSALFQLMTATALAASAIAFAPAAAQTAQPPELQPEESDVAPMPPLSPRWIFVSTAWAGQGTRIFDGDSGKMVGLIHHGPMANVTIDPRAKSYYVSETIWTKGNRGTRQDMVTVYDAKTMNLVREIPLPGRQLVSFRKNNFTVSADGRYGYSYNMDPASSIVVVDLDKNRVVQNIEVPGCGLSFAAVNDVVGSLCADGTIALAKVGSKAEVGHSASFFSAEDDPIFDNIVIDPTGKATMLSYTGLIYEAKLDAPELASGGAVAPGWSVQEAAGMPKPTSAPVVANWFPGGRQPLAVHRASGKLFVLMHMGEYWSQKEGGEEVWVLDGASKKLLARRKLPDHAGLIEVTQDAKPLVYVNNEACKLWVFDAETFALKYELSDVGSGILATAAK